MRTNHFTITPSDIKAYAGLLLQKHLRLKDHGPKCCASRLWTVLLYAAARICSLAAACAALADAPSDTAAHDALLAGLPAFAELQRRLNRALQGDLPKAVRRRRQPLAIDLTLIPYHGKHLQSLRELYAFRESQGLPSAYHLLHYTQSPSLVSKQLETSNPLLIFFAQVCTGGSFS